MKRSRALTGLLFLVLLVTGAIVLLQTGVYGWTLFIFCPVLLGAIAAWAFQPRSAGEAATAGGLVTMIALVLLIPAMLEGVLCVVMALPLAVALGAFGGWLGFYATSSQRASQAFLMLALALPGSLTWDLRALSPVYEVRTAIEIRATAEQVWKHVVTFTEIPEPQEWFFRAGLAYPERARIVGSGVGAVRYCEFSTGTFVEPIEIWQEPRLLRFRVSDSPAPMRELTPYSHLGPRHLHGYLVSRQGEFRLTQLPNHHTLLEGTTWYQHGLWPSQYWRWWSDAIIHRIHLRVLSHIRSLAEQDGQAGQLRNR